MPGGFPTGIVIEKHLKALKHRIDILTIDSIENFRKIPVRSTLSKISVSAIAAKELSVIAYRREEQS